MIMDQFQPLRDVTRIRMIAGYDLFNPALRHRLDEISQRTATVLGMPTSLVSLVLDTVQVFVGGFGLRGMIAYAQGSPLEWAFCAHAVMSGQRTYVVTDATTDPRHATSPLVTREGVRAYAGAPITGVDGQLLGMHCVLAESPREFTGDELAVLEAAAFEISGLIATFRHSQRHDAAAPLHRPAGLTPTTSPVNGTARRTAAHILN